MVYIATNAASYRKLKLGMGRCSSALLIVSLAILSRAALSQGLNSASSVSSRCGVSILQLSKDKDLDGCLNLSGSGSIVTSLLGPPNEDLSDSLARYFQSVSKRTPST